MNTSAWDDGEEEAVVTWDERQRVEGHRNVSCEGC